MQTFRWVRFERYLSVDVAHLWPRGAAVGCAYRGVSRVLAMVAVAGLVAACGDSARDQAGARSGAPAAPVVDYDLSVKNIRVLMTSGTLTLREIRAEKGTFNETSRVMTATSITLHMRLDRPAQDIVATADRGRVFLAGKRESPKAAEDPEARVGAMVLKEAGRDRLRASGKALISEGVGPGKAKVGESKRKESPPLSREELLAYASLADGRRSFGDIVLEGPVRGRTSEGGWFMGGKVIWSEKLQRLMVLESFDQDQPLPDGPRLAMSGWGFQVDSTLQRWTYHYTDSEPFRGALSSSPAPTVKAEVKSE